MLSQVKLIAEPWDVGRGRLPGRQLPRAVGGVERQVPRHRARVLEGRRAARSASSRTRLTGSSDLYERERPPPVRQHQLRHRHDGFTLRDLVSYNDKHNEANGEDNRDGPTTTTSRGTAASRARPTTPAIIDAARAAEAQLPRDAAALAGRADAAAPATRSAARSSGNNNAYCQDNEISWFDWNLDGRRKALLDFTRRLIRLRRRQPVLRRQFFHGRAIRADVKDLPGSGPTAAR